MSDAKKAATPAPAPEGGGHGGKKNSKLLIMIIVGVLVLALIGGGVYFKMKKSSDEEDEEDPAHPPKKEQPKVEKKEKKKVVAHSGPPIFYKFEKAFTIRLQTVPPEERYMQIEMQLRLLDLTVQEQIKQYEPEIKYRITLLMLSKKPEEVSTSDGVQRMSNEVRDAINNVLDPPPPRLQTAKPAEASDTAGPSEPVQAVLFTTFVVQ
ncbi:MAG TPA: flagellar basal body-associated FliL family protein [Rhodocyclaceae bacterium]|nr:flagellar basal body-associated FliL family protein [Rhodocyclaceae bacterium]